MKLLITIHDARTPRRKPVLLETPVNDRQGKFALAKKLFEAEQALNGLSGTPLRWHFNLEE